MAGSKRRRGRKRGQGIVANLRDPKKIRLLYIIVGLALVFGGSLSFSGAGCPGRRKGGQTPDTEQRIKPTDAIAELEGQKITYEEYERLLERQRRQQEAQDKDTVIHPPEYYSDLNYRVIRQLIDMKYFDISARAAGIDVTPEEVETEVDKVRQMLVPSTVMEEDRSLLQRLFDSVQSVKKEQTFEKSLREATLDPNITLGSFRDMVTQQLVAQAYIKQLKDEQQKIINDALTARMNTIKAEIVGGKDFGEAAKQYSEDSSSAAGGLIPLIKHGNADLPRPLVDTAFSLPVGEVSSPVLASAPEEKAGAWLVTVLTRKEASGADWVAGRETLRSQLLAEKVKKVEAGTMQMPSEGNLTVTDEDLVNYYEEATIRVIFLKGEDPMAKVQAKVESDMKGLDIKIYDPELRAMHHIYSQQWSLAAADYEEALQKNSGRLAADKSNQVVIDNEEARLRYLLANLWSTRAFRAEAEWLQMKWAEFQANPGAFGGEFPVTPPDIKKGQQGYFVLALRNLDRAIAINDIDPWSRMQRSQIDLGREQITPRLIEDLSEASKNSSDDFNLENRVLASIKQAVSLDDKALENAGGTRPESVVSTVLPEDTLGLTLETLSAPYKALIGQWETEAGGNGNVSTAGSGEAANTSGAGPDSILSVANGEIEPTEEVSDEVPPPLVPIAASTPPLPQLLRDQLNALLDTVQRTVDRLTAARQQKQAEQQAQLEQQRSQLPPAQNPQPAPQNPPPSDEANNLIQEGTGGGQAGDGGNPGNTGQ
jgi:parvulin-like peptidyl-prolyl isomerase